MIRDDIQPLFTSWFEKWKAFGLKFNKVAAGDFTSYGITLKRSITDPNLFCWEYKSLDDLKNGIAPAVFNGKRYQGHSPAPGSSPDAQYGIHIIHDSNAESLPDSIKESVKEEFAFVSKCPTKIWLHVHMNKDLNHISFEYECEPDKANVVSMFSYLGTGKGINIGKKSTDTLKLISDIFTNEIRCVSVYVKLEANKDYTVTLHAFQSSVQLKDNQ